MLLRGEKQLLCAFLIFARFLFSLFTLFALKWSNISVNDWLVEIMFLLVHFLMTQCNQYFRQFMCINYNVIKKRRAFFSFEKRRHYRLDINQKRMKKILRTRMHVCRFLVNYYSVHLWVSAYVVKTESEISDAMLVSGRELKVSMFVCSISQLRMK